MFGFVFPSSCDGGFCTQCTMEQDETGGRCSLCQSVPEMRKPFYIEKAINYLSQYRSSSMQGDRDIAWLALQKANAMVGRVNKLETTFQINTLLFKERIQED